MSVSSLGGVSAAIAQFATAQAAQNADLAAAVAVLNQALDAQSAILTLISETLGQNVDVLA